MDPVDVACRTKKYHSTKSQAKKALKEMKKRGVRDLVIYDCWFCDGFHLGHLPGGQTYRRPGRPFG